MNTDATAAVVRAEEALARAQQNLAEAKKKAEFLESFNRMDTVYVLVRRSIDRGSLESILGVFYTRHSAERFAAGTPSYGLDKDLFIEDYSMLS